MFLIVTQSILFRVCPDVLIPCYLLADHKVYALYAKCDNLPDKRRSDETTVTSKEAAECAAVENKKAALIRKAAVSRDSTQRQSFSL